jgi:hypothetical protein
MGLLNTKKLTLTCSIHENRWVLKITKLNITYFKFQACSSTIEIFNAHLLQS